METIEKGQETTFTIKPDVNKAKEFIEIATDFSNPLDIVREAISNSYDAGAKHINILFDVIDSYSESILKITIIDDGKGMDREGLQSFFDLGNSLRKGLNGYIGEKGHGTKIYLNSNKISVSTTQNNVTYKAVLDNPFNKLHDSELPTVNVTRIDDSGKKNGTKIEILGYNRNERSKFTHSNLKDYTIWFTKHGAIDNVFDPEKYSDVKLHLKGLDFDKTEEIHWGHIFPEESKKPEALFNEYYTDAPKYYSKKIVRKGFLRNFPEIEYHAVFSIEGTNVKYNYNRMLRHSGYSAPKDAYTIQERYGLWLCKDFIPVQKKNEWITSKGSEYTKFHAFFNCQALKLTANRGSIENTSNDILKDIENEVKKVYEEILESDDWTNLDYLEEEASGYKTVKKEKQNFEIRQKKINKANIAVHKGVTLVEPQKEAGVYAMLLQLSTLEPELFPFQIIDYDTHEGIDVIVKGNNKTPIYSSKLYYVEFKNSFMNNFNHSFENLHSIVCWDTKVKHDEVVTDIRQEERKMKIIKDEDYTKYFLDDEKKAHKIEVFVLKDYLKNKLNLDFRPRTSDAIF